jgi:hypothetical protein
LPAQAAVGPSPSQLPNSKSLSRVIWVLLALMALSIGRAAVVQNKNYIDLKQYAQLQEKPPFQNRILMAYVLRAATHNGPFLHLYDALFHKTVDTPEDFTVMVSDCICILLMLPLTAALRRTIQPAPRTSWLAPLMMLLIVAFTYVVRYEQSFTMPYDFLSLLFYTLGVLAILRRSGWLLLLILVIAAPNRETAVFLVPMWFWMEWRAGRRISAAAYSLAGLLICFAWQREIAHILHASHQPYVFPWANNLVSIFVPVHWPQLLSVFAFLAIPMWMLRRTITDPRLKNLWLSTLPFIAAALIVGVWRETRIFGELSAIAAVTFAMQLEQVVPEVSA